MQKTIRRVCKSFYHAGNGLRLVWQGTMFRIMVAIAGVVVIASIALPVSRKEAVVLLFSIVIVLVLEVLNTIIEHLVDMLQPRLHTYVRSIKDMMAAAVLLASIGAFFIGILIFLPYFSPLLSFLAS